MLIETTEEGLALHSLGLLRAEDIPELAILFLDADCDVLEMAALAGAPASDHPADRRAEFERAVRACGRVLPDRVTAAKVLRKAYARRGLSGKMGPREAARAIIDLFHGVQAVLPDVGQYLGESFGIYALIGRYYSYHDVAADDRAAIGELDAQLCTELGRLAERPIEEQIRDLEERLLKLEVRASAVELDRLISDEFVEFGSSGRVYDKAAIIAALNADPGVRGPTIVDFRVLALTGGVVLATYRLGGSLRSSVWRTERDEWRILFHQGTPTTGRL